MEEWRDIIGYEGLYQISNYGKVKRVACCVEYRDGRVYDYIERTLRQGKTKDGYRCVNLSKGSKTEGFFVHRLVAAHFVLNPNNKPNVNHLNGNRSDNSFENLEWCTQSENILHSYKMGYRASKETRLKLSEAGKKKIFTETHRKNISIAQSGENSHRSMPIVDTSTGLEYVSLKDFAIKNGLNYHTTKGQFRNNKLKHLRKTVKA